MDIITDVTFTPSLCPRFIARDCAHRCIIKSNSIDQNQRHSKLIYAAVVLREPNRSPYPFLHNTPNGQFQIRAEWGEGRNNSRMFIVRNRCHFSINIIMRLRFTTTTSKPIRFLRAKVINAIFFLFIIDIILLRLIPFIRIPVLYPILARNSVRHFSLPKIIIPIIPSIRPVIRRFLLNFFNIKDTILKAPTSVNLNRQHPCQFDFRHINPCSQRFG